jgi:hypothetical protein
MEATVLKEVSERMISVMDLDANPETDAALRQGHRERAAEGPDSYKEDLSPRNLATLVETTAQSSTRAERQHATLTAELADRSIRGPAGQALDAKRMGDILRGSELTLNLTAKSLFGADNGINDQRINAFHNPETTERMRGAGYMGFRDAVERGLFPELGNAPALGNERPTYAALNTSGNITGAASDYGECVLVLRPETARRATYTVSDSFNTIPLEFTQARKEACLAALNHLPVPTDFPGETPADANRLRADAVNLQYPTSSLRQTIQEALDSITKEGSRMTLAQWESSLTPEQLSAVTHPLARPVLVQAFTDVAAQRARTATHDTLETLLPQMSEVQSASLMRAAMDGTERFRLTGDYIEAQVQGSLLISRDVGEIRVDGYAILNRDKTINEERLSALREFTARHNITLTITDCSRAFESPARTPDTPAVVRDLRGQGLTVHRQGDIMTGRLPDLNRSTSEMEIAAAAFNQSHQSIKGTREAAEALLKPENSEEFTARLLTLLPVEAQGGALPLAGAALDRVCGRFRDNVNQTLKAAATAGQGINTETVLADALKAAAEKPLAQKAALLRELEQLEFDNPAQKAAFSNWVISARALSDPAEMRLIHANASALAARLERLGQNPAPEALAREFNNAAENLSVSVGAYRTEIAGTGREFGGDDIGAEFNRTSFMAAEFLRANNPALAANLLQILDSPRMSEFRGVCARLSEEMIGRGAAASSSAPGLREELTDVQNMTWVLNLTADALATQLGQPPRRDPGFNLPLDYASPGARAILSASRPGLADMLNADFPQKTPRSIAAFHAPAQGAIQADWSGRRAFHRDMLDAYRAHEESFDPDGVHGLAHASRVFIFGTVLGNIMRERDATVDMTALTCAASAHDSGREGNGADRWEEQSADIALAALQRQFSGAAPGAEYAQDFRAQIMHPTSFRADETPTLEAWLMQSADAMDIGRTKDFNMEQWIFLREPVQLPDGGPVVPPEQRLREKLVREADTLRMLSDPAAQTRVHINELTGAMIDSDHPEELMAQKNELLAATTDALRGLRELSNEDYMARIENTIRAHSKELPLLNEFYFKQ